MKLVLNPRTLGINLIICLLSIFIYPLQASAKQTSVLIQEADLYPGGSAAGIHLAENGSLIILDRKDEIWIVDPITGDYQDYYGMSGSELYDISLESSEFIWWTDASQMFGSMNTSTNQVKYWDGFFKEGDPDYWANNPQLGPLIYDNDLIWLSEWSGEYFGLLRFNPTTCEICSYNVSIHAADVIKYGNNLYVLDWHLDALLRFDPITGQLIEYPTGQFIGLNADLASDGSLLWWTEDVEDGGIISFNPVTFTMTTYDLPVGEQPRHFHFSDEKVWYTNANGSFGRLDPLIAAYSTSSLTETVIWESITPICKILAPPVIDVAGREPDGTFAWVDNSSTQTEPLIGIQSYSLPDGAEPFGIFNIDSHVWLTDPGRQKLIDMELEVQPESFFIYLPLIIN